MSLGPTPSVLNYSTVIGQEVDVTPTQHVYIISTSRLLQKGNPTCMMLLVGALSDKTLAAEHKCPIRTSCCLPGKYGKIRQASGDGQKKPVTWLVAKRDGFLPLFRFKRWVKRGSVTAPPSKQVVASSSLVSRSKGS